MARRVQTEQVYDPHRGAHGMANNGHDEDDDGGPYNLDDLSDHDDYDQEDDQAPQANKK